MYDALHETSVMSEEGQEETFDRLLKPAAPPDSGNGVVVPHEAPDGPPPAPRLMSAARVGPVLYSLMLMFKGQD